MDVNNMNHPALVIIFPNTRGSERDEDQDAHLNQPKSYPSIPESTAFDALFWQEQVPLLIQSDVAVKSANLAVLTLIFSQSAVGAGSDHYEESLWHYGRALQLVRQAITSEAGLQPAILCCMFFVIFEIMNGDTRAAESHLWNGEKMLSELQSLGSGPGGIEVKEQGSLRRELPCALQFLMMQSDFPNLDFGMVGNLEAFIQMATSPDRSPNIVKSGHQD